MKNLFIIIIVLVALVLGGWFIVGTSENAEAPTLADSSDNATEATSAVPAPGNPDVEEMIVSKDGTQNDDEGGETDESAMTPEVKEFNVSGKNFSFEPALITVKKGDTVKITFDNTAGFHDFKIDEFSVATTQASSPDSQTVEFIAGKTGDFEYYCSVGNHRAQGMVGVLRVE